MKYRTKLIVIDAIQYTGDNIDNIKKCFPNIAISLIRQCYTVGWCEENYRERIEEELKIATLGGNTKVNNGDWIIKGVNGGFYPVKNDIFLKTYEAAEDDTKST